MTFHKTATRSKTRATSDEATLRALWRRLFGAGSLGARATFDAFSRTAAAQVEAVELSFLRWRALWRSTSNLSLAETKRDGLEQWRDTAAEYRSLLDYARDPDRLLFLVQTHVAQTIIAIVERYFALDGTLVSTLFEPNLFSWANDARRALGVDDQRLDALKLADSARDPFADVYSVFFSYETRRLLGEFYTPQETAKFLATRARNLWKKKNGDAPRLSTLDPTCGAGVFLTTSLRTALEEGTSPREALNLVEGYDLSPLAVVAARANLLFVAFADLARTKRADAVAQLVQSRREFDPRAPILPVRLFDALRDRPAFEDESKDERRFDLLLGNPPWITWDKLAEDYRRETKEYWREYGLFNLSNRDARYGGGKKELSGLIVYATIDRRLKENGCFSFVLPKTLFQSEKSGDGFRRFGSQRVENAGNGRTPSPFTPLELDDFSALSLFPYVSSRATAATGRKGASRGEIFAARRWRPAKKRGEREKDANVSTREDDATERLKLALGCEVDFGEARPAENRPGAPLRFDFATRRKEASDTKTKRAIDELVSRLARDERGASSSYVAKLGANAAGASGVFWVEALDSLSSSIVRIRNLADVGRRETPRVEAEIESSLLFPLLRWRDVDEYRAAPPQTLMIIPQDPRTRRGYDLETMRERYPRALAYLERFEDILRARAAYKKYQNRAPFWSIYNVDESTFAPIKVVWRRMDSTLRAAVVEYDEARRRPIAPQDTLARVAVSTIDEADYLAAFLNSSHSRAIAAATTVAGAKNFGSPSLLARLAPPKYRSDDAVMRGLAALGRKMRLERPSV